jgi:hypothetical protein
MYSDPDPLAETNLYPELALELALVFVFDNQKSSLLRDPQTVADRPWRLNLRPADLEFPENKPDKRGSNLQRDSTVSGGCRLGSEWMALLWSPSAAGTSIHRVSSTL